MRRTREQIEKDAQIARKTEFHIYAPAERARRKAARQLQRQRATENGGVYFVEAVGLKKVKIGYAIDVKKRMAGLACGCPVPLRLLAFIKGPRDLEFNMHVKFWSTHSHGEWFRIGKRLTAFLAEQPLGTRIGTAPEEDRSMTDTRIDAKMMKALGKVWEREVASAFDGGMQLCQLSEKMTDRLAAAGLVERVEHVSRDRLGTFTVKGCILTHAGRYHYCASCEDEPEPALLEEEK